MDGRTPPDVPAAMLASRAGMIAFLEAERVTSQDPGPYLTRSTVDDIFLRVHLGDMPLPEG